MKKFLLLPMLLFCADHKTITNPILTEPIYTSHVMRYLRICEIPEVLSVSKEVNCNFNFKVPADQLFSNFVESRDMTKDVPEILPDLEKYLIENGGLSSSRFSSSQVCKFIEIYKSDGFSKFNKAFSDLLQHRPTPSEIETSWFIVEYCKACFGDLILNEEIHWPVYRAITFYTKMLELYPKMDLNRRCNLDSFMSYYEQKNTHKFDLMQHEIERLSMTIKMRDKEKDLLELKFKMELETEKSKQQQNDLKMIEDLKRQMEINQELMSAIERYNKVTNMQSGTVDSLIAKNTSLRRANRVLLPACLLLAVYSTYITLTKQSLLVNIGL